MASIRKLPSGKWQARYRPVPGGRQYSKTTRRKVDAERWLTEQTAAVVTGQFVEPKAGGIAFKAYADDWRAKQVHAASTRDHVETMLRRHVYPTFGERPLSSILPSDVQAWVRRLEDDLAPATIGVCHAIVSSVFKAAIRDRRVVANPCTGTRLPRIPTTEVVPPTTEQVRALTVAMPDELRALVTFAAGTGVRQGEAFGLTVDRLDFLRRTVRVDRQLVTVANQAPFLAPPKTSASVRTIPLPQAVVDALAAHLAAFPAEPEGFVFTLRGEPIRRSAFGHVWRPAVAAAGLPTGTTFHALRHYYVSLLIAAGEDVVTVQRRVGHKSATTTLDTYGHMFGTDADERTRDAVDRAFGGATEEPMRNAEGGGTRTRRSDEV